MTEQEKLLVEAARRGVLPKAPAKQERPRRPFGLTDVVVHGATAGLADEVSGGAAATAEFLNSLIKTGGDIGESASSAGRAYDTRLGEFRGDLEKYRAEHPWLSTGVEMLGGLASGGTLAKGGASLMNAAKPTAAQLMLRGAGEGAAYGGAYGFGTGEGAEDRLRSAATGAGLGSLVGGAVGGVGSKMASIAGRRLIPTARQLKEGGKAAYKAAGEAGLVITPSSLSRAVTDIADATKQAGIDKTIHPRATAALARLQEAAKSGGELTLQELETLRRVVKGAASSPEPDERRIASLMIEGIDDYVSGLSHADIAAGDPLKAVTELNKARDLWSRYRKTDMIEEAVTKATRRAASTGSGGNVDNAIRQNIRAILDNPKKIRGFTKEERELMESVVKGGKLQNLARLLGKLSPQGNGLMAALGIGATAANPAMAVFPAVGMVSKTIADRATPQRVNALLRATRSGGRPTPGSMLSEPQRALLEAMIVSGSQQGQNIPINGK